MGLPSRKFSETIGEALGKKTGYKIRSAFLKAGAIFDGAGVGFFSRPEEISMDFAVIEGARAGAYSVVREDSRPR